LTANFSILRDLAELEIENEENPFTDDTFYENRKKISKIRKKITGRGN